MNSSVKLITQAEKWINQQGFFLLIYDVIGSRKFAEEYGYKKLFGELWKFHKKINRKFQKIIVVHEIGLGNKLSRFRTILGDGGGAYFSDKNVIAPIIAIAEEILPFKLRWAIAQDGWDKKLKKFL